MTPEAEKLLRRIGWRPEHEHWWDDFAWLWGIVGTVEMIRHNLLVLALSEDIETRKGAAFEVAGSIMATAVVLRGRS